MGETTEEKHFTGVKRKLRIGFYTPYLATFGGGERYLLTLASCLSMHTVTVFTSVIDYDRLQKTFHLPLQHMHFQSDQWFVSKRLPKYWHLAFYDVFFLMTDGSIFPPVAKKNFLIIQSPIHIPSNTITARLKLSGWNILCYSAFMKDIIETKLKKHATILSPCVDVPAIYPGAQKKENIILTVGRFFQRPHNKKHEYLLETFQKYYEKYFRGYTLYILGGLTEKEGKDTVTTLKKQSNGYPVEILPNVSFSFLKQIYQRAKIYWHAAGFGEDITKHPERAEHFGITTLEAMAQGAVPVVFDAGGQRDIVEPDKNGFLWHTQEELIQQTRKLIENPRLYKHYSKQAWERSCDYSCATWYEKLIAIIAA